MSFLTLCNCFFSFRWIFFNSSSSDADDSASACFAKKEKKLIIIQSKSCGDKSKSLEMCKTYRMMTLELYQLLAYPLY